MWKSINDELPHVGDRVLVLISIPYRNNFRDVVRVATYCHPRCTERWYIPGADVVIEVKQWAPFVWPEAKSE